MTNAEYFKEQIEELLDSNHELAMVKGKLVPCLSITCDMCDFHSRGKSCVYDTFKWLISEHGEPPIKASELADDTKVFVSNEDDFHRASRRYFAKNSYNKLFVYRNGATSWTSTLESNHWNYMWLEDGTRVVEG